MGGRSGGSGGRLNRYTSGGGSYVTHEEPRQVTIPGNGMQSTSYGEGTRNDSNGTYHVYLTDEYGGMYADSGTVQGYEIGSTVQVEDGNEGRIIAAHIYPNGTVDYNVEVQDRWSPRPNRRNRSKATLDQYNRR